MKIILALAASIFITGCGGVTSTKQMDTLPDVIQVGQSILNRDSIPATDYPTLDDSARQELSLLTGFDVPAGTQLIGEREAINGIKLKAYTIPTGENINQFKVILATSDGKKRFINSIDLGEFHTCEHQMPLRFGGNRFYTTDAELRFDGQDRFTVHRVMTLTSLFLKDHTLTEIWRVEWDNHYEINSNGKFIFKGQQETMRTESVDDPVIEQFKSRNLPQ